MAKYQAYAEYKDSGVEWLGEIPSHWKVVKLSYKLRLLSGDGITAFDIEDTGTYPVFGGNGLRGFTEKYNCDGEYALVGRQGALCGNINVARGKFFATEHAVVVYPYEKFNLTYLSEFLRFMDLGQYSVSAAQPGIAVDRINALPIVTPTLDEQNSIGDFLDHETAKIDHLIEKQQQLIELLKEKRQAVISHAVTKGLDPNVPMKDSGVEWLGEVPEHWTILKLSAIADITRLAGYEYTEYWQSDDEGEIIAIRGQNIRFNKLVNLDDAEKITNKLSIRLKRSRLYKNDIAYPCVGTIGNAVLIHESDKYHINQNIAKLTPNEKIYPLYLTYFLNSSICLESALFLNTSDAQPSILVGNLRKVKIAFPQLAEQIKIADSISNQLFMLDNLILKAELTISLMQERRTALISAAVTGKIDVRNWKAPRVAEANTELSA
ncbi:restriction endonuclease subunit S [Acinetobacter radioresistens]|uniref:restriction endonuclease subunit S n=1 Tax=Acinetobacter radioresistens TaxID=40216 RepID=UPI003984DDED